jgi:hypothetical protein
MHLADHRMPGGDYNSGLLTISAMASEIEKAWSLNNPR